MREAVRRRTLVIIFLWPFAAAALALAWGTHVVGSGLLFYGVTRA